MSSRHALMTPVDGVSSDAFAERVLHSAAGAFELFSIYLGDQLGYYTALAGAAAMTSGELAATTRTSERYTREWLEQQTVVGILVVDDAGAPAPLRRYSLPASHADVLASEDSLNYLAPLAQMLAGAVTPLQRVIEAYRSGRGVPYEEFGDQFRAGQGRINRSLFLQQLGQAWLPSIPDVHARLLGGTPSRVADIGCGVGWSSIGLALSYPDVHVHGFDSDAPSLELARAFAAQAGVADRVSFHAVEVGADAIGGAGTGARGAYDVVMALECVHDMTDPVSALRAMRQMAGNDGAVIVVDERVADEFLGAGGDVEWLMYGWSILHCLPVGMNHDHAAGTGTVMRKATLASYAGAAGFTRVETLPIDNFLFRVYRLHGGLGT
jgi:SAM-dependent methyltransferase